MDGWIVGWVVGRVGGGSVGGWIDIGHCSDTWKTCVCLSEETLNCQPFFRSTVVCETGFGLPEPECHYIIVRIIKKIEWVYLWEED